MKSVNIICQSVGQVGKSYLTYLFYLKTLNENRIKFFDFSSITQTTLKGLPANKVSSFSLRGSYFQVDRALFNNFFEYVEKEEDIDAFYLDMGSLESVEFVHYIITNWELNITPEYFLEIMDTFKIDLNLHVVVAFGDIYEITIKYLDEIIYSMGKYFKIKVWANMHKFNIDRDIDKFKMLYGYQDKKVSIEQF